MRKLKWIFLLTLALHFLINDASGQSTVPPGETQSAGQSAANGNQQQAGSDTTGGSASQSDASQSEAEDDSDSGSAANTPAVPQLTTSGSGSPALLSGGNGKDRDGTNNVQRATMNMAGADKNGKKGNKSKKEKRDDRK